MQCTPLRAFWSLGGGCISGPLRLCTAHCPCSTRWGRGEAWLSPLDPNFPCCDVFGWALGMWAVADLTVCYYADLAHRWGEEVSAAEILSWKLGWGLSQLGLSGWCWGLCLDHRCGMGWNGRGTPEGGILGAEIGHWKRGRQYLRMLCAVVGELSRLRTRGWCLSAPAGKLREGGQGGWVICRRPGVLRLGSLAGRRCSAREQHARSD